MDYHEDGFSIYTLLEKKYKKYLRKYANISIKSVLIIFNPFAVQGVNNSKNLVHFSKKSQKNPKNLINPKKIP